MVTKLLQSLRRLIGSWMVEVSDTHVTVWRKRHKTGVRVSLANMIAANDQVKTPRGWVPQVGETVAVLPRRHRAVVQAVIECVPELVIKVRYPRGTIRMYEQSKLVPVDSPRLLIECERVQIWT